MALSDHDFQRVVLVNPETGDDYAIMAAGDDFSGPAVAKHDFIRAILVNPETGDDYKAAAGGGGGASNIVILEAEEEIPTDAPANTIFVRKAE